MLRCVPRVWASRRTANFELPLPIANRQCSSYFDWVLAAAALTPVVVLLLEASTLPEAPLAALHRWGVGWILLFLGRRALARLVTSAALTSAARSVVASEEWEYADFRGYRLLLLQPVKRKTIPVWKRWLSCTCL